jgi:hypothetical protein
MGSEYSLNPKNIAKVIPQINDRSASTNKGMERIALAVTTPGVCERTLKFRTTSSIETSIRGERTSKKIKEDQNPIGAGQ